MGEAQEGGRVPQFRAHSQRYTSITKTTPPTPQQSTNWEPNNQRYEPMGPILAQTSTVTLTINLNFLDLCPLVRGATMWGKQPHRFRKTYLEAITGSTHLPLSLHLHEVTCSLAPV